MYSILLRGLMTQANTARLIANLPLEPFSLISPSDDEVVTFITIGSALGFLCGALTLSSYKHPAVFLLAVSLIDYLCKCLKVEPLTSRHFAAVSSWLTPTPNLTEGSEKRKNSKHRRRR